MRPYNRAMARQEATVPVVLVFSGLDPTGGAGLAADLEAIASQGCHPAPVATALTVQDTRDVLRFEPVAPGLLVEQARAVLEDMPVAAVKIGMVGTATVAECIHTLLAERPELPVVLDPVLGSGVGTPLAEPGLEQALTSLLVPLATVATPNGPEALRLVPEADSPEAAALALLEAGCGHVLLTGGHEAGDAVVNRLYGGRRLLETFRWERLPGAFHGSGCTLAGALAGLLAQGREIFGAVHQAQQYTHEALRAAYRAGRGQRLPNRLFWARDEGRA